MSEPIWPGFWELVLRALGPAREAGRAYIDSGRYVSKVDTRKYRESDQGWPLVVGDRVGADGPPDWSSIFSLKPGKYSNVLIDDVPPLAESIRGAVELAERNEDFATGLSYLWCVEDAERRHFYAQIEFISIVGAILGRAEALDVEDEEDLLALYLQVERGRFQSELTGDIIVPLVMTSFETADPVHLIGSYWLEPLNEELHRARALSMHHTDSVSPWIAAAATHAIVERNAIFPNTMWPPNVGRGSTPSPVPLDTVNQILECIHIATGKKSGYAQVVVRSDDWVSSSGWLGSLPHVWRAATMKAYPDEFDGGWLRPKEPITSEDVSDIASIIAGLTQSPSNVQLAARRCLRSTFRADIEDEILDATIGIEALLSQDRDELTHRMSQRAAAALASEFRADAIYNLLKQVYTQRSQIVHGSTPKNSKVKFGDAEFWTNHIGVFLLRHLLRNYLLAEEPWTPATLDALILERLGRWEAEDAS